MAELAEMTIELGMRDTVPVVRIRLEVDGAPAMLEQDCPSKLAALALVAMATRYPNEMAAAATMMTRRLRAERN